MEDQPLYFGHLRHWSPDVLAEQLRCGDLLVPATRQCVVLARIAWTKHRKLQLSLASWLAGGALLALAYAVAP